MSESRRVEKSDCVLYYNEKNELHREDGPAIEKTDGTKEWWVDGRNLTEEAFKLWRNNLPQKWVWADGLVEYKFQGQKVSQKEYDEAVHALMKGFPKPTWKCSDGQIMDTFEEAQKYEKKINSFEGKVEKLWLELQEEYNLLTASYDRKVNNTESIALASLAGELKGLKLAIDKIQALLEQEGLK